MGGDLISPNSLSQNIFHSSMYILVQSINDDHRNITLNNANVFVLLTKAIA